GGDDEKAVDYKIRAAEKAQRHWAYTEALSHFDSAVKRLAAMPDSEPNRLRRIDAVVKQSEIMFALGRHAEHIQALEAIRDVVDPTPPRARRGAWYFWPGFLHNMTGAGPEVPISYCQKALEMGEASGLEKTRAFAGCCQTHVSSAWGDLGGG